MRFILSLLGGLGAALFMIGLLAFIHGLNGQAPASIAGLGPVVEDWSPTDYCAAAVLLTALGAGLFTFSGFLLIPRYEK